MNIFILDDNPQISAACLCDKHISKMIVESAQMMACALIRHGVKSNQMPLTSNGTPHKGGYHHHPCSRWAGDSRDNYIWLCCHAIELCRQFYLRYGKAHACQSAVIDMVAMNEEIPQGKLTPYVQAMPVEYKDKDAVKAYRRYYIAEKSFAKWEKGVKPPKWYYN
jgi:hypothetical protein